MGVYDIGLLSTRNDVQKFLDRVHTTLQNDANFTLIKNRKVEKINPKYTTETCMLTLEYDNDDVINEIRSLSVKHYYKTHFDDKQRDATPLFVFIKEIQEKQVYIKIRLKEREDDEKVICISFHFAEHEVCRLPYT